MRISEKFPSSAKQSAGGVSRAPGIYIKYKGGKTFNTNIPSIKTMPPPFVGHFFTLNGFIHTSLLFCSILHYCDSKSNFDVP